MTDLRWGILGTGRIAGIFSRGVLASQTGRLAAVGSRAQATADRFAREYRVARAHGSYEALLADPGVQAVYVATPHPHHAEWTMRAAQAGKHVLCEKPLTLNHAQAVTVVEAARAAGTMLLSIWRSGRRRRAAYGGVHVSLPPADGARGGTREERRTWPGGPRAGEFWLSTGIQS